MSFKIFKGSIVLVADGRGATYYQNAEDGKVSLQKFAELSSHLKHGEGAAPTPIGTSPHEHDEAGFAKHIANDLYERAHKGEFKSLIIVADPQTLGQVRPSLHKEVTAMIVGELPKTLTNSSLSEIEKSISSALKN